MVVLWTKKERLGDESLQLWVMSLSNTQKLAIVELRKSFYIDFMCEIYLFAGKVR